jgi:hypothetical protein
MPKWMEHYRDSFVNTGGNDIESMQNGNADPRVNLPLSTLQACVKSQVSFLYQLKKKGLLLAERDHQVRDAALEEAAEVADSCDRRGVAESIRALKNNIK